MSEQKCSNSFKIPPQQEPLGEAILEFSLIFQGATASSIPGAKPVGGILYPVFITMGI